MNITDVPSLPDFEGDKLEAIFTKQRELMDKYHDIEKSNGLLQTEDCPVDLHDRMGQSRLKDMTWRSVEELTEATEAWDQGHQEHAQEEIADTLHFLTEMLILVGFNEETLFESILKVQQFSGGQLDKLQFLFNTAIEYHTHRKGIKPPVFEYGDVHEAAYAYIQELGNSMNCLKQKPWKQHHILTDVVRFKTNLTKAYIKFIELCVVVGLDANSLFDLYYRKSEVNKFRQRSNY